MQTLVAFSQNQLKHPAEFQKALKLHLQMLVEIQETELDKKMEQLRAIWWWAAQFSLTVCTVRI